MNTHYIPISADVLVIQSPVKTQPTSFIAEPSLKWTALLLPRWAEGWEVKYGISCVINHNTNISALQCIWKVTVQLWLHSNAQPGNTGTGNIGRSWLTANNNFQTLYTTEKSQDSVNSPLLSLRP